MITRVGICSYGYASKVFHIPLIKALPQYFKIVAIVERHRTESAEHFPEATVYRSCEEMLANPNIDLVVVNTPNPSHFEYAYKALTMGKHVVVDKPFASSVSEAQSLIELAKRQNLLLTVFHNRRWEGELLLVKEMVDKNAVGELLEAEFKFERYRMGLNSKLHKEIQAKGNGIVYELGTHLIDQAIFIFGMPKEVYAHIDKVRTDSLVDDRFVINLYYTNRLTVTLKSSLLVMDQGPAYILHGIKGSFTKHRANIQELQLANGMQPDNPQFAQESEESAAKLTIAGHDMLIETQLCKSPQSSYLGFYMQLGEALNGRASVPVDPLDALNGLKIVESAYESESKGTRVKLS